MRGFVAGVWLALVLTSPAAAQDASDEAEARRLFEQGSAAAREERLEDARRLFRGSLELYPRDQTRYNVAFVLSEAGHPAEALEFLELIDREAMEDADLIALYDALLPNLRAAVGRVRTTMEGVPQTEWLIDGEPVGTISEGETVDHVVDPGEHVVSAIEGNTVREIVSVERGHIVEVHLAMEPRIETPTVVAGPDLWWVGLIAGIAAAGIAAGVVAYVVIDSQPGLLSDIDDVRTTLGEATLGEAASIIPIEAVRF